FSAPTTRRIHSFIPLPPAPNYFTPYTKNSAVDQACPPLLGRAGLAAVYTFYLQLHAHIPGAPDNGAQVTHAVGIAYQMDMAGGRSHRLRIVANGDDNVIAGHIKGLSVFILEGHAVRANLLDSGLQVYRRFVVSQRFPEEGGIGQAHAPQSDKIVLHLHHNGLLTLADQVIGDLAAAEA